jgi:hypothetical protein
MNVLALSLFVDLLPGIWRHGRTRFAFQGGFEGPPSYCFRVPGLDGWDASSSPCFAQARCELLAMFISAGPSRLSDIRVARSRAKGVGQSPGSSLLASAD